MEFVSLGTIIYDLLNIIRGARISDNEPITEKQVEAWVHQYRALFIKRDIDKGKYINPDYVQTIDNIGLEYDSTRDLYRTDTQIPRTLDFNRKSGIIFVGDIYGNRIQLIPESRYLTYKYSRYSKDDTIAFLKNHRLYIPNSKGLASISIRGIFNVPAEAAELNGESFTYDSYYPIPLEMIPGLKHEILKQELGIEMSAPVDTKNDATHELNK